MKKIVLLIMASFLLSGCTGIITGHEYKKEDLVIVYKVVKNGVVTFMTSEEIKEAELDKTDLFVTDSYKLLTKTELEQEKAKKAEEVKEAKSQDTSEVSTTESSLIKIKWTCKGRVKAKNIFNSFLDEDSNTLNTLNNDFKLLKNNHNDTLVTFQLYCYW